MAPGRLRRLLAELRHRHHLPHIPAVALEAGGGAASFHPAGSRRWGVRGAGAAAVASFLAAALAEIYLCGICSCQEILRRRRRPLAPLPASEPASCGAPSDGDDRPPRAISAAAAARGGRCHALLGRARHRTQEGGAREGDGGGAGGAGDGRGRRAVVNLLEQAKRSLSRAELTRGGQTDCMGCVRPGWTVPLAL
jgi:hypothetical protein